jgi:prepilin peptidase CpaA
VPLAIALIPMFGLLAIAAVIDMRSRRIPNWLTLSLATAGLVQSFLPWHTATPLQSLLGLLLGFVLNIGLFALQIRGGGDVKLFAGLGAWMGPLATFEVFLASTIIAAVVALVQCALSGKLRALLRNTAMLAVSAAHPRELGVAHMTRPDGSFRSVGRPVPYALPVILAALSVLAFG